MIPPYTQSIKFEGLSQMKMLSLPGLVALMAGAALTSSSPAAATEFCNLKETKDGFVALRAGPGAETRLLARMTSRDEVMIGQGQQGKWVEVTWWRGDERLSGKHGGRGLRGWVNGGLLGDLCG
jgi:hypothetical protein